MAENNFLIIEIPYKSSLCNVVLAYGAVLSTTNKWKCESLSRKKGNRELNLELPIGTSEILFNDNKIEIDVLEEGKPVGLYFAAERFKRIYVRIEHQDNNKEEKKEILFEFFRAAQDYYNKKDDNEIICKILKNSGWSTLSRLRKRKIETIYLPKKDKNLIHDDIIKFRDSEEEYLELGIPWKRNYLLEGPPGTGKTSLIFALASELNMNIYIINLGPKVDDSVFMSAISLLPNNSILLLEDIDSLFVERKANDSNRSMVSFSGILNVLDGLARKNGLITFLTTNYKNRLDRALIRPGRIDFCMTFKEAEKEQIEQMYQKFLPDKADLFEKFFDKIEQLKFTMSSLQQFLLECRFQQNSPLKIKRLKEIIKQIEGKNDTPVGMYN